VAAGSRAVAVHRRVPVCLHHDLGAVGPARIPDALLPLADQGQLRQRVRPHLGVPRAGVAGRRRDLVHGSRRERHAEHLPAQGERRQPGGGLRRRRRLHRRSPDARAGVQVAATGGGHGPTGPGRLHSTLHPVGAGHAQERGRLGHATDVHRCHVEPGARQHPGRRRAGAVRRAAARRRGAHLPVAAHDHLRIHVGRADAGGLPVPPGHALRGCAGVGVGRRDLAVARQGRDGQRLSRRVHVQRDCRRRGHGTVRVLMGQRPDDRSDHGRCGNGAGGSGDHADAGRLVSRRRGGVLDGQSGARLGSGGGDLPHVQHGGCRRLHGAAPVGTWRSEHRANVSESVLGRPHGALLRGGTIAPGHGGGGRRRERQRARAGAPAAVPALPGHRAAAHLLWSGHGPDL